jgi:hypothetical protein
MALTKPANPQPGQLLLSRIPRTDFLTVTYPDGQSAKVVWRGLHIDLIRLGIPKLKVERVVDYVYNFYHCYVTLGENDVVMMSPPVLKQAPKEGWKAPIVKDRMPPNEPA